MTSQEMLAENTAPAQSLRGVSPNERTARAAVFAAGFCVVGMLILLVGQLGWWTLLAAPAYLATTAITLMLARGRSNALMAVAFTTASMGLVVAMVKLTGLA